MKLHIFGSASGIPTRQRFNTSVVLETSGSIYLFDAGEPCSSLLIRKTIDCRRIRSIFISHMHADHVGGIPQLIQTLELSNCKGAIDLFVPEEAVERLRGMLDALYLIPETLPFLATISPIHEGYFYKDEYIKVKAIANAHLKKDAGYRKILELIQTKYGNYFHSYSFLIEGEGKRIVYSGDLSDVRELDEFIDNIDLLILEFAHIASQETLRFLSKRDLSKVILIHLNRKLDDSNKKELNQLKMQIKDCMPDRVIIAKDGLSIEL